MNPSREDVGEATITLPDPQAAASQKVFFARVGMLLLVAGRLVVSSGDRRRRRRKSNELDVIDDAQNGHVDRRVRTSHRRHRREAFRGEEDEVADTGVDGVERD